MRLSDVKAFRIPPEVIGQTDDSLREAGKEGFERMVLWSGRFDASDFIVRTLYAPRQISYRLAEGLCYQVQGEDLHRLNVWLYEAQEVLAIQVHSHPKQAYHSDTDDSYAVTTALGSVSIVVPHFGKLGILGTGTAYYRLESQGWRRLDGIESNKLIVLED